MHTLFLRIQRRSSISPSVKLKTREVVAPFLGKHGKIWGIPFTLKVIDSPEKSVEFIMLLCSSISTNLQFSLTERLDIQNLL
jgi:hypothetical protein